MSSRAATQDEGNGVQPFVYRPVADGFAEISPVPERERQSETNTKADVCTMIEGARQEGYAEAERLARSEYEGKLAAQRAEIDLAIEEFARQRESYFEGVEMEIVNLSLSIAHKILHREAQIDPLLLVGLVHVALEKLDGATQVRLRVNPANLPVWERHFREAANKSPALEMVGDTAVAPDGCALETEVGTTTIGIETHLKEIERGFFDLLAQRPR